MRVPAPVFHKLRLCQDTRLSSKRAGSSISRGVVCRGVREIQCAIPVALEKNPIFLYKRGSEAPPPEVLSARSLVPPALGSGDMGTAGCLQPTGWGRWLPSESCACCLHTAPGGMLFHSFSNCSLQRLAPLQGLFIAVAPVACCSMVFLWNRWRIA